MRITRIALLCAPAILGLATVAGAQGYQQPYTQTQPNSPLGNAAGAVNNFLNPQTGNQQRQEERRERDYDRQNVGTGPFARYSNDQLRSEDRHLDEQRRELREEMRRRNID